MDRRMNEWTSEQHIQSQIFRIQLQIEVIVRGDGWVWKDLDLTAKITWEECLMHEVLRNEGSDQVRKWREVQAAPTVISANSVTQGMEGKILLSWMPPEFEKSNKTCLCC